MEEEIYRGFIQKLANTHYRILLISEAEDHLPSYFENIMTELPNADIEAISCAKEGCWEADIVLLAGAATEQPVLLSKIREVATQKIVAGVFLQDESLAEASTQNLQRWLPHSRVLELMLNPENTGTTCSGEDPEALAMMNKLLRTTASGSIQ
jgi:hypothetical protein